MNENIEANAPSVNTGGSNLAVYDLDTLRLERPLLDDELLTAYLTHDGNLIMISKELGLHVNIIKALLEQKPLELMQTADHREKSKETLAAMSLANSMVANKKLMKMLANLDTSKPTPHNIYSIAIAAKISSQASMEVKGELKDKAPAIQINIRQVRESMAMLDEIRKELKVRELETVPGTSSTEITTKEIVYAPKEAKSARRKPNKELSEANRLREARKLIAKHDASGCTEHSASGVSSPGTGSSDLSTGEGDRSPDPSQLG